MACKLLVATRQLHSVVYRIIAQTAQATVHKHKTVEGTVQSIQCPTLQYW